MPKLPTRPLAQNKYPEQYMGNTSFDEEYGINTVEIVGHDGINLQRVNASNINIRIAYDGNSNPQYIGKAAPGSLTSEAKWMIQYLTFDGNSNVTSITYANGSPNFNAVWDNYGDGTYIYS